MKIDINELLKILPKLIRENDTVKGAIITALSGVVATREDIKDIIHEMDERFEAMQKQMNERFEMMMVEMADQKRITGLLKEFTEKRLTDLDSKMKRVLEIVEETRDHIRDFS